jgi:hypothetical protein
MEKRDCTSEYEIKKRAEEKEGCCLHISCRKWLLANEACVSIGRARQPTERICTMVVENSAIEHCLK